MARGASRSGATASVSPSRGELEGLDDEAAAAVIRLRQMHQFYTVVHFCRTFRTTLNLPYFTPKQLERALVEPRAESSSFLSSVVARLLFGARSSVRTEQQRQRDEWERELVGWMDGVTGHVEREQEKAGEEEVGEEEDEKEDSFEEDEGYMSYEDWNRKNPLQEGGFFGTNPTVRLLILRELCEARSQEDETVRETACLEFDGVDPHGSPLGIDSEGYVYYHDGSNAPRIYREKPRKKALKGQRDSVPQQWDTVASTVEEVEGLLKFFKRSKKGVDKELAEILDEDILPPLREAKETAERRAILDEQRLKRKAEWEARRAAMGEGKRSSRLVALEIQKKEEEEQRVLREAQRLEEEKRRREEEAARIEEEKRLLVLLEERNKKAKKLLNRRVKILWEEDGTWYRGKIMSYDSEKGEHKIYYRLDESEEMLDMFSEDIKWEFDTEPSPPPPLPPPPPPPKVEVAKPVQNPAAGVQPFSVKPPLPAKGHSVAPQQASLPKKDNTPASIPSAPSIVEQPIPTPLTSFGRPGVAPMGQPRPAFQPPSSSSAPSVPSSSAPRPFMPPASTPSQLNNFQKNFALVQSMQFAQMQAMLLQNPQLLQSLQQSQSLPNTQLLQALHSLQNTQPTADTNYYTMMNGQASQMHGVPMHQVQKPSAPPEVAKPSKEVEKPPPLPVTQPDEVKASPSSTPKIAEGTSGPSPSHPAKVISPIKIEGPPSSPSNGMGPALTLPPEATPLDTEIKPPPLVKSSSADNGHA